MGWKRDRIRASLLRGWGRMSRWGGSWSGSNGGFVGAEGLILEAALLGLLLLLVGLERVFILLLM